MNRETARRSLKVERGRRKRSISTNGDLSSASQIGCRRSAIGVEREILVSNIERFCGERRIVTSNGHIAVQLGSYVLDSVRNNAANIDNLVSKCIADADNAI